MTVTAILIRLKSTKVQDAYFVFYVECHDPLPLSVISMLVLE